MVYSYTQIIQYLRCPRSYRYRYLDGWQEKETRAAMVFGRCFEKALGAYFCQEDSAAVLFKEWDAYHDAPLAFRKGEFWDRFHRGSIHSRHLLGIIAFGFAFQRKICKSKCFGHCREGTNSLPILTPSGRSMASTA